jgi:hypothetical protein
MNNLYIKARTTAQLFLNKFGGASVALSLRKLKDTSTNVVRVRRSSDNLEQNFTATQITDGTLTTFCGAGDGFVPIWYDQSRNFFNAVQTVASKQPKIVSLGSLIFLDGKETLDFGVENGIIEMTIIAIKDLPLKSFSFYNVRNTQTTTSNTSSLVWDGLDDLAYFNYTSSVGLGARVFWRNLGSITETNSGDISNKRYIFGMDYSNILNNYKLYRNGNQVATLNTSGTAGTFVNFFLGSNAGSSYGGKMQEFIAYPSSTLTDKSGIEQDINNYYTIY